VLFNFYHFVKNLFKNPCRATIATPQHHNVAPHRYTTKSVNKAATMTVDKPENPELDSGSESGSESETEQQPQTTTQQKTPIPAPAAVEKPPLPPQTDPKDLDISTLSPTTPEIIARQATINIGTIGHVAHGKSTVVKAISGVQTVRFKNGSCPYCVLAVFSSSSHLDDISFLRNNTDTNIS
jgi:hypothetical protein